MDGDQEESMVTVHCLLANVSQGENIGDGGRAIPHFASAAKLGIGANHIGILIATVSDSPDDVWTGADVCEHVLIVEHGHSGLRVKEEPQWTSGAAEVGASIAAY